ncbi:hypothetical protein Ae201684P_011557 [Aphanomyces euteiches]|uniref:Uncharacterized protein n=1 Tax=Aphanomyces euteiches TaxID=100861 RepID=A0A6G0XXG3_9STRA|nr:hypothetical protein Ae201684_000316 [Aphanomyces euteiches]KAH9092018.1 hypothetical protein Ae201684P_011557 [Aphanomyces euteiches]
MDSLLMDVVVANRLMGKGLGWVSWSFDDGARTDGQDNSDWSWRWSPVVVVVGVTAGALVPLAMSIFGTVVSGVGTLHAAGGVAAALQVIAAKLTVASITIGAAIGAAVASIASKASSKSKIA